ncbi:MAG: hypothetical protein J6T62_00470 [Fibrobacter sp.]|nr:hypothetical protein [Fibrobacter sp.]
MANVYEKQNSEKALKYVYTAKKKFSKLKFAKEIEFWWVVVASIMSILISYHEPEEICFYLNYEKIELLLVVINIFVLLLSNPLNLYLSKRQEYAANIQQCFDALCYNDENAKIQIIDKDSYLSEDQRSDVLTNVLPKDRSKWENWYHDYSSRPLFEQILFSQKESYKWSNKLKVAFLVVYIITCIIYLSFIFLYFGIKIDVKFVAILSSCIIFIEHCINAFYNISCDLYSLHSIKKYAESIDVKDPQNPTKKDIQQLVFLQSKIYDYRKSNYQVPDLLYQIYRKSLQNFFEKKAQVLNEGNV